MAMERRQAGPLMSGAVALAGERQGMSSPARLARVAPGGMERQAGK
ncbi:hypothetical protein KUA08_03960 [Komagataeibacter melomenusus]|nr:hypothetical protein [Komagataeibacter melomenusus]MBV1829777.1 hypothetical protein [Komagataeibacter melomenusus]